MFVQYCLTIIYSSCNAGSNLDGALTTFVSQFINKPGASTVPQLLEGIVNTAERIILWPSFVETGPMLQKYRQRSTAMTVVHKLVQMKSSNYDMKIRNSTNKIISFKKKWPDLTAF